mmetsp:Transcript_440/g.1150  ORF Transcript_440/g.1150 Transcript_440/m.1150 type:complete len:216 (+) Transcript_440:72-719(+)
MDVKKKKRKKASKGEASSLTAVDEEIARLEAELEAADDTAGDDEKDDVDDDALIFSSLESERIAPLPASQLPAAHCRKPTKRPRTLEGRQERRGPAADPAVVAQARRLVDAAGATEKVKIPFACRLCNFRGADLDDFEAHRASQLHVVATRLYKEASFCGLCRVQCTSPLELRTHTVSKKHQERLAGNGHRGPGLSSSSNRTRDHAATDADRHRR